MSFGVAAGSNGGFSGFNLGGEPKEIESNGHQTGNSSFEVGDQTDEVDEIEVDEDDLEDVDEVSGVQMIRFDEAPIPYGCVDDWRQTSRILKFKLNPNGIDGIGFISQDPHSEKTIKVYPQETKIYTIETPFFTNSDLYVEFVSNLYSIYEALGDEKNYSVPTIGLVKRDAQREHNEVLNKAFGMVVKEVESYIESKRLNNEDESSIFELEECLNIINCLKALYFSTPEELPKLICEWVNKADPQPDLELTESIMSFEKPYKHPFFWKFIKKLTLRGLYLNAANALRESKFEELQSIDLNLYNLISDSINLLESYPENSSIDIFKQWRLIAIKASSNASIRNDNDLELSNNIRSFLNILSGNKEEILNSSESWYESILALIYYDIPSSEFLQDYFELSISKNLPNDLIIWESACLNIFENKFLVMLRSIGSFNVTIAAYVSVLCEAKGLLKSYSLKDEVNIDEDLFSNDKFSSRLLYSHALDCLSISKLIPVGIGILATSKHPLSRSVIAEYLPRYEFKTNDDIEWALTICAKLKLPQISNAIYRIAGQKSLSNGFLLESLTFFSKAGEIGIIKYHCWNIFENSLMLGKSINDLVINSIVDDSILISKDIEISISPIIRQFLSPYAILYKFWKYQEDGDLKNSFKNLILLLKFKYLPKKLFGILIFLTLPFLIFNSNLRILNTNELILIINILDEFESQEKTVKNEKLLIESNDFYKYYIEKSEKSELLKLFQLKEIKYPKDLDELFLIVRKRINYEISKTFLFE